MNLFLVYAVIKDVIKSSYPRWLKRVFVSNKNIYVLLAFDSITEIQEAFKKLTKKITISFPFRTHPDFSMLYALNVL